MKQITQPAPMLELDNQSALLSLPLVPHKDNTSARNDENIFHISCNFGDVPDFIVDKNIETEAMHDPIKLFDNLSAGAETGSFSRNKEIEMDMEWNSDENVRMEMDLVEMIALKNNRDSNKSS